MDYFERIKGRPSLVLQITKSYAHTRRIDFAKQCWAGWSTAREQPLTDELCQDADDQIISVE